MYRRGIEQPLRAALGDTPVVLLVGARQTGKTTLVRDLGSYYTFDNAAVLAAADTDPEGFVARACAQTSRTIVLDEVQFVPRVFPAIKLCVDKDRRPGRFLLTGSANVLLLPKLSETLAGRMEVLPLYPLAQSEVAGTHRNLVDELFAGTVRSEPAIGTGPSHKELAARVLAGGYPEPLARPPGERREAWFGAYATTILQRDVRQMSNVEGLAQMPRLLALLASRCAQIINMADISRVLALPYTTLQRYMALLEATFLLRMLPAWAGDIGGRMSKAPKLLFGDTGLAASLLRVGYREEEDSIGPMMGPLIENFVAMEIAKLASWSRSRPMLYHWRSPSRQEVDLILEGPAQQVVGIEVKAAATVTSSDFRHLRAFAGIAGTRFRCGAVLYGGSHVLPFGADLFAVPIDALWVGPGAQAVPPARATGC